MPRSDERGGKRVGSGRKKGQTEASLLPKAPPTSTVLSLLGDTKMPEMKAMAVRLACMGKRPSEIYEQLGIAESTFFSWKLEPWWKPAVEATLKDLIAAPTTVFSDFLPAAMATMGESFGSEELEDHKWAAKEVWDRLFGKAVTRQQTDTALQINITFKSHGQEPIEGEFREVEGD